MATRPQTPVFALDEELWFGDKEDAEAERRAAASLAATGARIVGAKPFPVAARRLDELTRNPNTRMEQVVMVLESDPALSARLLRLVNSAGYGLKVRCTSVRHAAVLVGTRRLNQVATTAAILDLFDGTSGLGMELLEHASVVGSLCRYLAVHLGLPHDELFTCGFLHDIGKLMLLDAERERYAELLQEFGNAPDQMHLAERQVFGFDHAVLGAHVLAAWNIPEPVPRVIAWHHSPARALQDTVLAGMVETLRLADLLAYVLPMTDVRLGIELVAAGDAAQYLEISEAQLAAMWPDLVMLLERSRARSHGEPELDVIVPKVEVPASLSPRASREPNASRGPSRPIQEVPAHFPCSVCGKPSYGNVCSACGGQICPDHQIGQDEWCTHCVREYPRFKKNYRPSLAIRVGVGLLVGATVSVAVVSAARSPEASAGTIAIAAFMVAALWAVVLPVAYRLWYRLLFLENRRRSPIDSLPIARPHSIPIRSVMPKEALPTLAAPPGSSTKLRVEESLAPSSEPRLSIGGPLSMAPLSMAPSSQSLGSLRASQSVGPSSSRMPAPQSLAPQSLAPRSLAPQSLAGRDSQSPQSVAPASVSRRSRSLSPLNRVRSVMPVSPPPESSDLTSRGPETPRSPAASSRSFASLASEAPAPSLVPEAQVSAVEATPLAVSPSLPLPAPVAAEVEPPLRAPSLVAPAPSVRAVAARPSVSGELAASPLGQSLAPVETCMTVTPSMLAMPSLPAESPFPNAKSVPVTESMLVAPATLMAVESSVPGESRPAPIPLLSEVLAKPVDSAERVESAKPAEHVEFPEPAKPAEPVEPAESAKRVESTEPAEPIESVVRFEPAPPAEPAAAADRDDTCSPSGHSGAHPVLRLEDEQAFNSPLPRRVAAVVKKPMYACVGRPPLRPSQRPAPARGRETA